MFNTTQLFTNWMANNVVYISCSLTCNSTCSCHFCCNLGTYMFAQFGELILHPCKKKQLMWYHILWTTAIFNFNNLRPLQINFLFLSTTSICSFQHLKIPLFLYFYIYYKSFKWSLWMQLFLTMHYHGQRTIIPWTCKIKG